MTTVDTSTAAYATAGGRHVAHDSAGDDWVMVYSLADTRLEFWQSTDDGATFTEVTSLRETVAAGRAEVHDFFIGDDDRAAFATCGVDGYLVKYCADIRASSPSWSSLTFGSNTSQHTNDIRVAVISPYGSVYGVPVWTVLVFETGEGGELDWWTWHIKQSDDSEYTAQRNDITSTLGDMVAFDFEHTGNGKTPVTFPSIFFMYRDNSGSTRFQRREWAGSQIGWKTIPSARTISSVTGSTTDPIALTFDGTRVVMAYYDDDDLIRWKERDAADTATTSRTPTAHADGDVLSLSIGRDGDGNTRLFAVGATSDDLQRLTYDRAGDSFGTWETVATTTASGARSAHVAAGYRPGVGIAAVFTDAAGGSPYDVVFERDAFNSAPTAAAWSSPVNLSAQDVGETLGLVWVFADPDDGDSQSAYALERVVDGGSAEYYNAGTTTWSGTETKNVTGTESVTLASSWAADGESTVYRVKTWDAGDLEGVWSAGLTVVGSVPVTPVLTAPADAATITANTIGAVTWTAAEQTAYRVRILTSGGATISDTGKVSGSDLSVSPATVLADGLTGATVDVRVWNNEGLEGPTDSHTFDVDFVEPATPTLVVAADDANGRVSVTVTDPTPAGLQPTVTTRDLFVRCASGELQVGERTPNTDGIRIVAGSTDSVLYDYGAASGVDFEYMVRARADNGTSSDSAWT